MAGLRSLKVGLDLTRYNSPQTIGLRRSTASHDHTPYPVFVCLVFRIADFFSLCSKAVVMAPMAMWICEIENCGKSSVRTEGECILCDRHLCAQHLDSKYHKCPKWEVSISASDGESRANIWLCTGRKSLGTSFSRSRAEGNQ